MKVEGRNPIRGTSVKRKSGANASGAGGFAGNLDVDGAGDAGPAAPLSAPAPVQSVDALLALQSADDGEEGRRRSVARAQDLLDQLEDLRRTLLLGTVSRERLENLSRLVQDRREQIADPKLAELLDEIDLRVQVELAKYLR